MKDIVYEQHWHDDPKFPIIFHYDTLHRYNEKFTMHYHENIEILYFVKGNGVATCGANHVEVGPGDLLVVNSNELHFLYTTSTELDYYCLIADKSFCESFQVDVEDMMLQNLIQDRELVGSMERIIIEMGERQKHYKSAVQGLVIVLLTQFYRNYSLNQRAVSDTTWNHKMDTVKKAIVYIKNNFTKTLTIDELCHHAGFSKYYMCRTFKEITGQTVVGYINFLRCDYARHLLSSGKYNVKESAEKCGIPNLSYFTKTYKKYMGHLPSQANQEVH
ncbi:MAG: AraC family transcriptional regulator [Niameybacter sp.]|uniref:AraC family transcriptional regulator n=1 Tax=Niameybacter sp. TaxID=2033640 RepID=UPI002FCAC985